MTWRRERLYTPGESDDPISTDDVLAWGAWFEKADRSVARTKVNDDVCVVTSFTGIDRSPWYEKPVLWETMIFGGPHHSMGQRYTSATSARAGHELWCKVARGTLTPEAVQCTEDVLRIDCEEEAVDREEVACRADEVTTWLTRSEISELFDISEQTLTNYVRLRMLHPRRVTHLEPHPDRFTYPYPETRKRRNALYDVLQIIAICRRSVDFPRRWKQGKLVPDLPQFLKPSHAAILDVYVTPVAISLIEFRVRYGYQCRRVACALCRQLHLCGSNASHKCWNNMASGTRYCVNRADGTVVSSELSALQAWKMAHQKEQDRLAPILIARDALAEGRFNEAGKIADQLEHDLAVPLRREITRAITFATDTQRPEGTT